MNRKNLLMIGLALTGLLAAARGEQAAARTWTSVSGATIEASYVGMEGTKIQLRRADGTGLEIDLEQLVEKDRAQAVAQAKAAGHLSDLGTGAVKVMESGKLPVFADGRWKGFHTVYETDTYRATVNQVGAIRLHVLEDGKPVGPEMIMIGRASYVDPATKAGVWRKFTTFAKPPAPAIKRGPAPLTLALEGMMDELVPFKTLLVLGPSGFAYTFEAKDPASVNVASGYALALSALKSFEPPREMTLPEIKRHTEGWQIILDGPEQARRTVTFWESMGQSVGGLARAELTGPWAQRRLAVHMPPVRKKERTLTMRYGPSYSGVPAYGGFGFVFNSEGQIRAEARVEIQ